ncbi:MAG: RNA polymerase sigma factor [Dyadobacter fermentans]
MNPNDTDIWKAFRNGDKAAFEQLLVRYYRAMFDYGLRFQPDEEQLRDDLHDLMITLWERRGHLNETSNLKFYLFKALRNQILNGKRSQRLFVDHEGVAEAELHSPESPLPDFAEVEATQRQTTQIQQVIAKLSRRQQEILHLKFFEELSNEQIAELLQISRAATANLLYTALRSFKDIWRRKALLAISILLCS